MPVTISHKYHEITAILPPGETIKLCFLMNGTFSQIINIVLIDDTKSDVPFIKGSLCWLIAISCSPRQHHGGVIAQYPKPHKLVLLHQT